MFRVDPSVYRHQSSLAATIRQLVSETRHAELKEAVVRLYSQRLKTAAGSLIDVSSDDFDRKFNLFILQYANSLPKLIDSLSEHCRKVGWSNLIDQLESVVASYFGPLDIKAELGLFGILDRLYFAHRLVEELHDHLMSRTGQPVLKWDMTTANLVVHQLLGDQFAARLDQITVEVSHKMVTSTNPGNPVNSGTDATSGHWPCFCQQAGLMLAL